MSRSVHASSPVLSRAHASAWDRRSVLFAALYLLLYLAIDWLSYVRPALTVGITPWNPEAGLTLAFLLLQGVRWAPVTVLAAAISEVLVHGNAAPGVVVLGGAVWIGLVYAGLAALLQHWRQAGPIRTALGAARFLSAAVATTLVVAAGYIGFFVATGELAPQEALRGIARYWLGDLNGVLMVTPLLLHSPDWRQTLRLLGDHWREILAQIAFVLLTLLVIFWLPAADQLRFFYLLFVPVIWIAWRWSLPGAMFAVLAIEIGLIIAARTGIHTPRFIDLQFLLVTLSSTALLLGAVVMERAEEAADRRRAEEQLRESDAALARAMRFAVAGELASALAHELNQPMTAVVSYLRAAEILAAPVVAKDERLQGTLSKAAEEAIRASEVLRRLRDFYRGGEAKRERIDIDQACEAVSRAFQERLRRAGVTLDLDVEPGLPALQGDRMQLEIVLHNLLANAIDAIRHSDAATRRVTLRAARRPDTLLLRVEDSGPGIAPEASASLFEPFLTSKPDGMGLGLALSRSLIRARGGDLICTRSETWGGACFSVELPFEPPIDLPPGTSRPATP
jgi:two-component system, LuxR family, sensor kinase FixL